MEPLLRTEGLTKYFAGPRLRRFAHGGTRALPAVDNVSLDVRRGETLGVVGESGCGKTTLARLMLRLIEPTRGRVIYRDRDLLSLPATQMRAMRRRLQIIFQDPYTSLDPHQNVLALLGEPLRVHGLVSNRTELERKVLEVLERVELPATQEFLSKFPEELSGGERQRIGIGRAIILEPEVIVADEPVTMLDANVKACIVALLRQLREKTGLTYVFITHELNLAYHFCDRVAVMYLGQIVELGETEAVIGSPQHPYTRLLIRVIPPLYPDPVWQAAIPEQTEHGGSPEGLLGCRFYPRCPVREERCRRAVPELVMTDREHAVACHLQTG